MLENALLFDTDGEIFILPDGAPAAPPLQLPTQVSAPTISGVLNAGETLSFQPGTWTANPAITNHQYSYRSRVPAGSWSAWSAWSPTTSYLIPDALAGQNFMIRVRATNDGGSTWVTGATNSVESGSIGSRLRTARATSEQLLFAGNSFVQTPNGALTSEGSHGGNLVANWPGGTMFDFVSFGSAQQVWNLNGNLRNNATWDVLLTSETPPSLETGYPMPSSGNSFTTTSFQNLFWYAEEAKRRGADVVLLIPWPPTGAEALRPNITGWFNYLRTWLETKTGRPVYLFPAHLGVKAMQDAGHSPISGDGLHLDHPYSRVLSGMYWSMVNKTSYPHVQSGYEALDLACWNVLQTYRHAGFGGLVEETAVTATDPLPSPLPLPSALYLNETPRYTNALTINSDAPGAMAATINGAGRRCVSWPKNFPVGTRIEFDVTVTGVASFFLRVADGQELGPTGLTDLLVLTAGTHHVDMTIGTQRAHFGMLMNAVPAAFAVTNFKATLP